MVFVARVSVYPPVKTSHVETMGAVGVVAHALMDSFVGRRERVGRHVTRCARGSHAEMTGAVVPVAIARRVKPVLGDNVATAFLPARGRSVEAMGAAVIVAPVVRANSVLQATVSVRPLAP